MISIENISKSFGKQLLFEDTGFRLNKKERVGLVGRNGHGKTTLFKMIIGAESPESGDIIVPKFYKIGYVEQHIEFKESDVLKEGMRGLNENEKNASWKVEKILAGLGFSEADMKKNPYNISGGYQVRLNLAKVLISEPDLLLLDEPTNYLDITSIRWIKRFLINWSRELLIITHDRSFMDAVITHTVGIHRKKMRKLLGDTGKYYAQIARDEEIYEKTRQNDEKRIVEIEQFITRFRAKARMANMAQSRIKLLDKKEKKEKLEAIQTLDFSFRYNPIKAKYIATIEDLEFSYDKELTLIKNLTFSVKNDERICVVGKNGKGKTTLLKLLAGTLAPLNGTINYNPNVITGVYEQTNIKSLVDSRTIVEEILYSEKDIDQQTARNIAGCMMFEGDDALKKIEVLSGGEKARVMLGKTLAKRVNLLILDEPTNHLDMDSCDALLEALQNFEGAVIMATHNEMFLHALAEKLIIFQNDETYSFEGTYADFLEKKGWQDEQIDFIKTPSKDKNETAPKINKKETRRARSEIINSRAKAIKPLELKIAEAENEIEAREKELDGLNAKIIELSQKREGAKLSEIYKAIHVCRTVIDERFEAMEALMNEIEAEKAVFDKQMKHS